MSIARNCALECSAEEGLKYFEFPDERKQNDRRKEWIDNLHINPSKDECVYLCERHFSERQRTPTGLKSTAVPDINLTFSSEFDETASFITCARNPGAMCKNFTEQWSPSDVSKSPTKYRIIDEIDLTKEKSPQKDYTKNGANASGYFEAFLRNLNEEVTENSSPTKILSVSNKIKGPVKLLGAMDAQGNYTPIVLKNFKICSQAVDNSDVPNKTLPKLVKLVKPVQPARKSLPIITPKNKQIVKNIRKSSCEHGRVNKKLPTLQNSRPRLYSVLKEPSETVLDKTAIISKEMKTRSAPPLTNESVKLLHTNYEKPTTIKSFNSNSNLNNNVPAVLENIRILPRATTSCGIDTEALSSDGSSIPKTVTAVPRTTTNSLEMRSHEELPLKKPYLSPVNITSILLPHNMNSGKVDTHKELLMRKLYSSRVNNIIGSKITVTLKEKTTAPNTTSESTQLRKVSSELSPNSPQYIARNNINTVAEKHDSAPSISREPRISYSSQFPKANLKDLSHSDNDFVGGPTDIGSSLNEVEFLTENSLSDSHSVLYSTLQTSSVLGDTDEDEQEDHLEGISNQPRKKQKKKAKQKALKEPKPNRKQREKRISTRERSREYKFRKNKTIDFKEVVPNTGRKTPPGLFSVLKEPSEIKRKNTWSGQSAQQNPSYLTAKGKSVSRNNPPIIIAESSGDSRSQSNFSKKLTSTPSHQNVNSPTLETWAVDSSGCHNNVPLTFDESMMVISRGVQTNGNYHYRSPTRLRLEKDVMYLRRTLEEGFEALKNLKITTKNALEILAENDARITNSICAKLPKEVTKLVRESLAKRDRYTEMS